MVFQGLLFFVLLRLVSLGMEIFCVQVGVLRLNGEHDYQSG